MTYINSQMVVKVPFDQRDLRFFNGFFATEKQESMDEFLIKQIDFEQLMFSGVILDHQPLHKSQDVNQIIDCFLEYESRLKSGFLSGTFTKYMHPLNMVKNYYGENYAFEFAFLVHYQAWLQYPSVLGLLLFAYQIWRYINSGDIQVALDTPYNSIYGLICCFWAKLFVESWKRTQKMLQSLWNCSDSSFSHYDERTAQFKYYHIFNEETTQIDRQKINMNKW